MQGKINLERLQRPNQWIHTRRALKQPTLMSSNELHITHDDVGTTHVLKLDGCVDNNTFNYFETELSSAVKEGHITIKLDFSKLTYINSTGLGLLMATYRQLRQMGGDLAVINLDDKTKGIFRLLGFSRLESRDE